MGKNLSNQYGQKLLDSAKKSRTDTIKTASKRAIQRTAESTGDFIGNKIADKRTSISKKFSVEHSKALQNDEIHVPQETYISSDKRQQIIDELRVV